MKNSTLFSTETRFKDRFYCCLESLKGNYKFLLVFMMIMGSFMQGVSAQGTLVPSCNLIGPLEACAVVDPSDTSGDFIINIEVARSGSPNLGVNPLTGLSDGTFNTNFLYSFASNSSGAFIRSYGPVNYNPTTNRTTQALVVFPGSGTPEFNLQLNATNTSSIPATVCECSKSVSISKVAVVSSHTPITCYGQLSSITAVGSFSDQGTYTYTLLPSGPSNSTGLFENLPGSEAGITYTIVCESAEGCIATTSQTITQPAFNPVVLNCPDTIITGACQTQQAVNSAFNAWLNSFGFTGGSTPVLTRTPAEPIAPSACGGATTVTWTVTDRCGEPQTCTRTFTVPTPPGVVVNGPQNSTTNACTYANQEEANTAFAAWLAQFTATGGCAPVGNYGQPQAPAYCGGSIDVTFNVTDRCYPGSSITRTFTITPAPAVNVTTAQNSSTNACVYANQEAANAAFATWLQGFGVTGGCAPLGSFGEGQPSAPAYCGGSTTVVYTVRDKCYNTTTYTRVFTITPAPAVVVNGPQTTSSNACSYANQEAANAAFATWLQGFTVTGGCAPAGSYGQPQAPAYCGGSVDVTFNVTDRCYPGSSITRTFTITPAPQVNVTAAADNTTSACAYANQEAATAAFNAWLAQFTVSGGCAPIGSFGEGTPQAPAACGGSTTVTYTVSDKCYQSTQYTRTFTITPAPLVVANGPASTSTNACTYANQEAANAAFATWLQGFTVTGGCAPTGSYGQPQAPAYCGGSVDVTYNVSDKCYPGSSITRTFTITPAPNVVVNGPQTSTTNACAYANQEEANAAFAAWLAGFTVSGGCAPTGSYGQPVAPAYCGGTTSVTYTVADKCFNGASITRLFIITPAPAVVVTPADSASSSACTYANQEAANAAFATWLQGFSVTGGCAPIGSFGEGQPSAPAYCGGSTTVTYTVSDKCYQSTQYTRTFTITPAPQANVGSPENSTTNACAYANQDAADAAFASWLAGFTVTGGCAPTGSYGQPQAPAYCGGSVEVTYVVNDKCSDSTSVTRTFTITPAPAVNVTAATDSRTSSCIYANQAAATTAFNAWLAQFTVSGGCAPIGSFGEGTPQAPAVCGGSTTVTYTVSDKCYQSTQYTRTFTITAAPEVAISGPENSTSNACAYANQEAANAAFTAWLAGFTVSGGCAPTGSYGQPVAPPHCGGSVEVTYTVSDKCYEGSSITRTFTITPAPAVVVNAPATSTTPSSTYANQAAADAAFAAWLAQFSVSGGCAPSGSYGQPQAPHYCGGSVEVTYVVNDKCSDTLSVTRVFTITPATPAEVNAPESTSTNACTYANQEAANTAFAAWLAQFTVSGGLSPIGSFGEGTPQAPQYCGGSTTVTYTVTDRCFEPVVITRTFTITPAPAVNVNGPENTSTSACAYANQEAANAAFATWLAQFNVTGGCAPMGVLGVVGAAQTEPTAPSACGGTITVSYSVIDKCYQGAFIVRTFTITPAPAVNVTGAQDSTTSACAYANQAAADAAFAAWLGGFTVSGGCSPIGSFGEGQPTAPAACGGSTTVTYTVTDKCYQTTTHTATFTITAPAPVVINANNVTHNSCEYADQAALNTAFAAWLNSFTVSGGCAPAGSIQGQPQAPALCTGGSVCVTFLVTDKCYAGGTVTKIFTLTPGTPVDVAGPANSTTSSCAYADQAAADAAYAAWLAQFQTVNAGCGATAHFNTSAQAPRICVGGSVTLTYSINDNCSQDSVTATFTITPTPNVVFNCGNDVTVPACSTQAQVNAAWTAFLASASASGGCGSGTLTNNAPAQAPSACGGSVAVTWTYNATGCGTSQTCTRTFTVASTPAVVFNCGTDVTVPACSTQAQVNAAWTAFLNSTTASGGCGGSLTRTQAQAPSLCGGSVNVTWTYTVASCGTTQSCTRTFTVAAPAPVVINCGNNVTLPACSTQAQLNAAWTAFLNSTTATGGCGGVLTRTSCSAPSLCGGYVDVTWKYTVASCGPQSGCGSSNYVTCTRRFTVAAPTQVTMQCGNNVNLPACSTQAQVDAAWATFLASTTASGGCGGVLTNNGGAAPSACGGYKDVTWTYTVGSCGTQSGCGSTNTVTCTKRFTVAAPSQVVFNCGANVTVGACKTQAQVNAAYASFLASTTASGGCGGVLTNNAPAQAPSACGGYVDVTWTYTVASCGTQSGCGANNSLTCTKRFTVTPTQEVVFNCGQNVTIPACSTQAQVNTAWNAFLASTTASGGCNGIFSRTNPTTPSSCGGSVDVTWTYTTSGCGGQPSTQTCTRTFTVAAPAPVVLTPGNNVTLPACSTQAQLNTAWTAFLNSTTATGGCGGRLTRTSCSAPSLCGGYVDVTWTYTVDTCGQSSGCGSSNSGTQSMSITRRFTVASPDPLTFSAGSNVTVPACSTQAQLNTAWNAFLNSVTVTGGCNATLTRTSCSAPSLCGGYVDVTWTATTASCGQQSGCGSSNSQSITRRFTVSAPTQVSFNCGSNVTLSGSSTPAQITAAWNAFLNSTTASGGCNGTFTRTNPTMPTQCGEYADVTWTYTVGSCGQQSGCGSSNSMTCTKRFTIGGGSTSVTINVNNVTVPSCKTQAQVNALWASFLTSATVSGGNGTLTNNGATRTIPSACGGYADVTWTYTGGCGQTVVTCGGQTTTVSGNYTVTRRFTVTSGGEVNVSGPSNVSYANTQFASQYAVNTAFANWLAQFKTISTGCGATAVFSGDNRVAPSWTNGGSVRVTYSITGNCNSDSVCATFTITKNGGSNCKTDAPSELKTAMAVKAYPNPFSESFGLDVTTSNVEKVGVAIYDMTGKLIEQREVNADEVSGLQVGDRFPTGVYNVIVTQGSDVKTLRVIKR
ncbi:MAG: T9SS type A sorting domain-containing protein [Flavobacterium sp.]